MPPPPPHPLFVELPLRVKTYDIDFVGHVNNIVYIRWLEDLRLKLLDAYYPLERVTEEGMAPVIVKTSIHYRQAIVLDDRHVTARMWIDDLAAATFRLAAEFRVGNDVRCTAEQRGTFINLSTLRPCRIPGGLREQYEAHRNGAEST
jgi:acyl-CoA thioester hydrolase